MRQKLMLRHLSCFLILAGIAAFSPLPAAGLTRLPGDLVVRPEIPVIPQPGLEIPVIEPDIKLKTFPAAPTELALTTVNSTQITVFWKDNATDETGYKIERSIKGGQWGLLSSLAANATSYTDTSAQPGNTYYYRVFAYNANGNSNYSNLVSAFIMVVPSNLRTVEKTSKEITISWEYKGTGQTGFGIQRKTGSGSWADIGSTDAGAMYYTDSGLQPETTYYYRVTAVYPAGNSDYSPLLVATTNQPAPVTNVNNVTNNNSNTTNNANTEVNIVNSNISNSNIASNNQINQTNSISNINNASTVMDYVKIMVNGDYLTSDVRPFLNKDGRVMVPFRAIGEKLGAQVDWEASTRTAVLTIEDVTVRVPINKQAIAVNGTEQQIDTFAIIKEGRTFIPVRAVSQALGAAVGWDQGTKTVDISM